MTKYILTDKAVVHAMDFAIRAHGTQTRKNGTTLYVTHPIGVAQMVADNGGDKVQVIAALLHDVIEDCEDVGYADVASEFGQEVADMVQDLTNTSKLQRPDLNRAGRKELDAKRLATVALRSQFVKLCDILYNVSDLDGMDSGFIVKFLKEKRYQTETMTSNWGSQDVEPNMCGLRTACLFRIQSELDKRL